MDTPAASPCDASLGKFDPSDARRLMDLLHQNSIHFEIEIGDKPKWGKQHQGAFIEVFVWEEHFQAGNSLAGTLFPAEVDPLVLRRGSPPASPKSKRK